MQDYLAMVLLSHVLDNKQEATSSTPPPESAVAFDFTPHLDRLESLLDKALG
jgi:hypothetical protein